MTDLDGEIVLPCLIAMLFFWLGALNLHRRLGNKISLWHLISLSLFLVTSVFAVAAQIFVTPDMFSPTPGFMLLALAVFAVPLFLLVATSVLFWRAVNTIKTPV